METQVKEERIDSEDFAEHEDIVRQKDADIHDFWEHVSNEDRVDDVCTTFVSESKLVTSRLYANSASFAEKCAVASFLRQVGALQFRILKSATNDNELQTVIILQKPGNTHHCEGESAPQGPVTQKDDQEKGPVKEESETPTPPPLHEPPASEEHECRKCQRVLSSLWELDLHMLEKCEAEKVTVTKQGIDTEPMKETTDESEEAISSGMEEDVTGNGETATKGDETATQDPVDGTESTSKEIATKTEASPIEDVKGTETSHTGTLIKTRTAPVRPEAQGEMTPFTPRLLRSSRKLGEGENQGTKKKRVRPRKYKLIPSESPVQDKETGLNSSETVVNDRHSGKSTEGKDECKDKMDKDHANDEQLSETDSSEGHGEGRRRNGTEEDNDLIVKEILLVNNESEEEVMLEADDVSVVTRTGESSKTTDTKKNASKSMCDICHKSYNSYYLAKHRMLVHSELKESFKCITCDKHYFSKGMFKRHLLMHQNKARNIKFTCSVCNMIFYDKYNRNYHEKIHNKKNFKCEFCDKTFIQDCMLKAHRNSAHTKEINYPCSICDKVFYVKFRLKEHMVTHSGKKEHKCEECGMEYFHLSRLKRHRRTVHVVGKPFMCALCGSVFKSKGALKQHHLTAHTDIKNFPCRQCGKPFSRSSLRNQHERVHEGVKPYPCEYCGKAFRNKSNLQVHLNWHSGIRPFSCEYCNKTFLVKGNLTKHMHLHTGERPYICELCGHGSVDTSQLRKHMMTAHNIHLPSMLTKAPGRADSELTSQTSE